MRSGWWRFWNRETWRGWQADRAAWSAFRAEARQLDERVGLQQSGSVRLGAQVREAEQRLRWVEAVGPQSVPVETAKSEPGLGAVGGVTLLEMRSRQGQAVWVAVDHGPVYFTDRRIVFGGGKQVEFRYERIESLHRVPEGLYVGVSSRKKPHVLAGPVEQLAVTLEAARLVAEGGNPAAVEAGRLDGLQGDLRALEVDLETSRRQRQALVAPPRPVSPAWLPGTAALVVVVAIAAAGGGGGGTTTADPAASSTTAATGTTEWVPTSAPDTTSTGPTSAATSTIVAPSSTLPASTTSSTLHDLSVVETIGFPAGVAGVAAVLESVTDGDTLRVRVDGRTEPLRLIGMNSPEQNECLAAEATAYLIQLTREGNLTMLGDVSDRDQYDRLLRYVWAGDVFLNEALVRSGLAISRRYPPDLAYADLFDQAQADAQQAHRGMWAANACGPAGTDAMVITDIEYDAPGDDNQNLNGEWVTLRNDGTGPVDLGGWVLKDESASHRFTFPAGFVLLAGETVTIYSGCGENTSKALYWCNQGSAIWNNDGDTAYLLDPSGNITTYESYTEQATTTTHATTTTRGTTTTTSTTCHPSYIPCLLIVSDYDCAGGSGNGPYYTGRVQVIGPDEYGLDRDHDGIGCE